MAGLTPTGFVPATLIEIRADLDSAFRDAYGASIKLGDTSSLGQVVGIFAERYALLWEAMEAVVAGNDPNKAIDTLLKALCAITGTVPEVATASTVTLTLTGTPTTPIAALSVASTTGTASRFATDSLGTITALTAWAITTAYVVGDRVTNAARAYVCITAGTSAGSGGPTTTSDDITDNGAHWRYMGEGTGAVDIVSTCEVTGPTVAISGEIVTLETPISGWDSVINLLDATLGQDVETNEALRLRRTTELSRPGEGTPSAIRAKLLDVASVTAATVFLNDTDTTDSDGVPPHSVEALVRGGLDQDIWDALLASVGGGIHTHGTEVGTATDTSGTHDEEFSRPTAIPIYVIITIEYDAATYPDDGDDQVAAAIVAFGDLASSGKDAVSSSIAAQGHKVAGVTNTSPCLIGIAPTPTLETTIAISNRELATHDTSRIIVNSSAVTP